MYFLSNVLYDESRNKRIGVIRKMEKFYRGVLRHSKLVILVFGILFLASLACRPFIQVNYDINDYLPKDSVIIASLLHDVCKADIYKAVVKKQKNSFGVWEDVPGYNVDYSNFPLGHGEKSVILLLLWGLDLSDDEIMAIRWHMSSWDLPFQSNDLKGNYNAAKNKCPLMGLIQAADGMATNFLEFKMGEE